MWIHKGRNLVFKFQTTKVLLFRNHLHSKASTTTQFSSPGFQNGKFFSTTSNCIGLYENARSLHQIPTPLSQTSIDNRNFIAEEEAKTQNPNVLFTQNNENNTQFETLSLEDKLLEEMPQRSYEHVQSVFSVLQSSLDESVFNSTLDKMGLTLNDRLMVTVIETPDIPGESLIRFFKWAFEKSEYVMNTLVLDCLVNAIGLGLKMGEIHSLWDLVKEIGEKEKGVVDTEILNQLIKLFWKLGRGKSGLEVFDKFEGFGCDPNSDSYYFTIEALYRCTMYDDAWLVCEKMVDAGKFPDSKKIGHIISCFCKGNKGKQAHLVYLRANERNGRPPVSAVKDLIRALCREDFTVKLAVDLLDVLSGDTRKYAIKLFSSVLSGLCRIRDVNESKRLLSKMIEEGPPPGNAEFSSVINLLSKDGQMEEVIDLVNVMELRGLRPDVYTYCAIVSGYSKRGQMEEAYRVLVEAKKNHLKLGPVAYHILARGYCKLEEFDKALELLNEMKESGVQPNADEYNKMIQSLCLKALDWRRAEKLLEEMREKGLHGNEISRCLVRAMKESEEHKLCAGDIGIQA